MESKYYSATNDLKSSDDQGQLLQEIIPDNSNPFCPFFPPNLLLFGVSAIPCYLTTFSLIPERYWH